MLCGDMCAKYVLNEFNIDSDKFNLAMKWTPQIALYLNKKGLSVKIYCYHSNLYSDYKKIGHSNLYFEGFKLIHDALNNDISITEKKLDNKELEDEISKSKFVILCVKSSFFNKNVKMNGGHFILLSGINNCGLIKVINPIKDKYEIKYFSASFLIDCCKEYGSWRILIGRKK